MKHCNCFLLMKLNVKHPTAAGENKKEKPKKKKNQKGKNLFKTAIITTGGFSSTKKITYGEFLKRPNCQSYFIFLPSER